MTAVKPHHLLALLLGLLFGLLGQAMVNAAEIRDRITPEQMRQRQAGIEWQQRDDASADRDPRVKSPVGQSIIKESVIVCDGRFWSLVPKKSILHLPGQHRQRLVEKPTGKPIPWSQFLGRNRSWLTTHEVDIPTAAGQQPIADETASAWAKRGCVVVAVHRGGPISVKRPEPEGQPAKS